MYTMMKCVSPKGDTILKQPISVMYGYADGKFTNYLCCLVIIAETCINVHILFFKTTTSGRLKKSNFENVETSTKGFQFNKAIDDLKTFLNNVLL